MCEARQPALRNVCGEKVVGHASQQILLDKRARCHHPHHLAVDEVASLRRLHLLADGDLIAPRDQLAEVGIERVVWNSRERHPLALAHGPRGQRDLELPRHRLCVLIERFVKVAEAEEE